jgi:hypothetical protein
MMELQVEGSARQFWLSQLVRFSLREDTICNIITELTREQNRRARFHSCVQSLPQYYIDSIVCANHCPK